jgi:hypothetical protein
MRGMLMDKLRTYIGLPGRLGEGQARDFYEYGRSTATVSYLMYPWERYQDQANATEERIAEYYAARKAEYTVQAQAKIDYLLLSPKPWPMPHRFSRRGRKILHGQQGKIQDRGAGQSSSPSGAA